MAGASHSASIAVPASSPTQGWPRPWKSRLPDLLNNRPLREDEPSLRGYKSLSDVEKRLPALSKLATDVNRATRMQGDPTWVTYQDAANGFHPQCPSFPDTAAEMFGYFDQFSNIDVGKNEDLLRLKELLEVIGAGSHSIKTVAESFANPTQPPHEHTYPYDEKKIAYTFRLGSQSVRLIQFNDLDLLVDGFIEEKKAHQWGRIRDTHFEAALRDVATMVFIMSAVFAKGIASFLTAAEHKQFYSSAIEYYYEQYPSRQDRDGLKQMLQRDDDQLKQVRAQMQQELNQTRSGIIDKHNKRIAKWESDYQKANEKWKKEGNEGDRPLKSSANPSGFRSKPALDMNVFQLSGLEETLEALIKNKKWQAERLDFMHEYFCMNSASKDNNVIEFVREDVCIAVDKNCRILVASIEKFASRYLGTNFLPLLDEFHLFWRHYNFIEGVKPGEKRHKLTQFLGKKYPEKNPQNANLVDLTTLGVGVCHYGSCCEQGHQTHRPHRRYPGFTHEYNLTKSRDRNLHQQGGYMDLLFTKIFGPVQEMFRFVAESVDKELYEDTLEGHRALLPADKYVASRTEEGEDNDFLAFWAWLSDVYTIPHTDGSDWPHGIAHMMPYGDYKDGHMMFPELGFMVEYTPGTVTLIRGGDLDHCINDYTGTRNCLVGTNKKEGFNLVKHLREHKGSYPRSTYEMRPIDKPSQWKAAPADVWGSWQKAQQRYEVKVKDAAARKEAAEEAQRKAEDDARADAENDARFGSDNWNEGMHTPRGEHFPGAGVNLLKRRGSIIEEEPEIEDQAVEQQSQSVNQPRAKKARTTTKSTKGRNNKGA